MWYLGEAVSLMLAVRRVVRRKHVREAIIEKAKAAIGASALRRVEASHLARKTASEVVALRPDLASGDAVSVVLGTDPSLTAAEVIAILDEATRDWAAENGPLSSTDMRA
jgi:hypothetical protein